MEEHHTVLIIQGWTPLSYFKLVLILQSGQTGGEMSVSDCLQVLKHIGELGLYQITLYSLLCIPGCLPAAFLAFSQVRHKSARISCHRVAWFVELFFSLQVFLSAEPGHWCAQPGLDQADPPLNLSHRYTVPGQGEPVHQIYKDRTG